MKYNIAVIHGDGIGPEVVGEALKVLDTIAAKYHHELVNNTNSQQYQQQTIIQLHRQQLSQSQKFSSYTYNHSPLPN